MGHRITNEWLRVNPAKVSAISEMQPSTNIKELRRFMGMANYLARFMPHLTDTVQPLHNLLKNDVPYVCSKSQQTSLDVANVMLAEAAVVAFGQGTGVGERSEWVRTGIGFATRWQASSIRIFSWTPLRSDRERNAERIVWFEQVSPLHVRWRCHCGDWP